ncbi:MAG: replicative DNA helicase [Thermosulfidibacteraceae bacterium]|jgi:replicative DNA helicase
MRKITESYELLKNLNILPPHNIEAERALLGSILLDGQSIIKILDLVEPQDFYRKEHQLIFTAMLKLFEKGNPIDAITVHEELTNMKCQDETGGIEYLIDLIDTVATSAHIVQYAKSVRDKAILRKLINTATEIIAKCYNTEVEDVEDLIDEAESMIFKISERYIKEDFSPTSDLIKLAISKLETLAQKRDRITGIPTGYYELDNLTAGLHPSDLIIVAARPGMGKTAFALNIAANAAINEKKTVAIFSLEMSKEQLAMRLLSQTARVDYQKLRTGTLIKDDWKRIIEAAEILTEAPIFIDDTPGISVIEMRAKARRLKHEHGIDLIIVDYLQLIKGRGRTENRQQEISEISRSLKTLAKELNVPVIAVSQLSRAVEARQDKRPQLSDLRESGAIEQDADLVIFIYREEVYKKLPHNKGVAEIIIGKQRNGPTGTIKLTFIKEFLRFEDHEEGNFGIIPDDDI